MNLSKTPRITFDSIDNSGFRNFLSRNFRDLAIYRYVLYNLIGNNLKARYRRSMFGFLWTLLNPIFTMSILAVVFSTIYKVKFADFGVYLFSGILPWTLISNSILHGSASIITGEGYLKKVYVPKLVFPLITVGVEGANFLFSLASLSIIAFFLGAKLYWGLLLLPLALSLTIFFVLGLILTTSIVAVYFRDLIHILQIVFLGLFYLTPIVYKEEQFENNFLILIKSNPFYYFIELFHQIIYEAKIPDQSLWLMCGIMAVTSLVVGLFIFSLKEKDVIYRL